MFQKVMKEWWLMILTEKSHRMFLNGKCFFDQKDDFHGLHFYWTNSLLGRTAGQAQSIDPWGQALDGQKLSQELSQSYNSFNQRHHKKSLLLESGIGFNPYSPLCALETGQSLLSGCMSFTFSGNLKLLKLLHFKCTAPWISLRSLWADISRYIG